MTPPVVTDPPPPLLANTFNFLVTLTLSGQRPPPTSPNISPPGNAGTRATLGDAGFQECSGLEIEMDVKEHREGGRNDGVIRLVGRAKYSNIVLKRGMVFNTDGVDRQFWEWIQQTVSARSTVPRYDGVINVLDGRRQRVLARWMFVRGLPAKIRGPDLNAKSGEVAIEELHIAHEGLAILEPT